MTAKVFIDGAAGTTGLEIRERLKLVKKGEKVYITGDPAKQ